MNLVAANIPTVKKMFTAAAPSFADQHRAMRDDSGLMKQIEKKAKENHESSHRKRSRKIPGFWIF